MGTNKTEGFGEKVVEFFTQHKDDRAYEAEGGDDRVPKEDRKGNPRLEARLYALSVGEQDPYPEDGPIEAQQHGTSDKEPSAEE